MDFFKGEIEKEKKKKELRDYIQVCFVGNNGTKRLFTFVITLNSVIYLSPSLSLSLSLSLSQNKFQFGRPVSHIREMGLPQIKEVVFVGCPSIGRGEGVSELRTMLWDIAFSLTVPRRKGNRLQIHIRTSCLLGE